MTNLEKKKNQSKGRKPFWGTMIIKKKSKPFLCELILYIFLALFVVVALNWGGMNLSYDSKRYLIGSELFSQRGWNEGMGFILPHHAPFYSIVLAAGQTLYTDRLNTEGFLPMPRYIVRDIPWAEAVSILGFVSLVVAMFIFGWHLGGALVAHFSAILTLFFLPGHKVFMWAWSETIYLPISILCLLMLFLYNKRGGWFYFFASAILAALAFFTRFLGASLILAGFFVILLNQFQNKSIERSLLWAAIAFLPVLLYLGIDRATGSVTHGFFYQLFGFVKSIHRDFAVVGILVLVLGLFLKVRLWWGAVFYAGLYSVVIIVVASTVWIDPIGGYGDLHPYECSRLLMPIYPIFLFYISLVLVRLFRKGQHEA